MTFSHWQPASFRGVPFYVERHGNDGGRRGPDHEFPNKEEGYAEDTGKKMERYSFDAYVCRLVDDKDYPVRRDALKKALNQKGPGELVHPAFGTIRVQVRSWKLSEDKNSFGYVPFKISFVEASEAQYPTARRSAASAMGSAALGAHNAVRQSFANSFSLSSKSDFLRDNAVADAGLIGELFSRLCSSFALPVDIDGLLAVLTGAIQSGRHDDDGAGVADAVIAFPCSIAAWHEEPWKHKRNLDGSYRGRSSYAGAGPLAESAVASLYKAFDFTLDTTGIESLSAMRRQRGENAKAMAAMVRDSAVIEAARVAPFVNWPTLQAAESASDKLAAALDAMMEAAASDDVYQAAYTMRLIMVRSVPPDDGQLPSVVDYSPLTTTTTLSLSNRLYGTGGHAGALAAINGLRHPGFVPGQTPIKVLSNVG
jgi:Mu-like prophage DNA circulation protein